MRRPPERPGCPGGGFSHPSREGGEQDRGKPGGSRLSPPPLSRDRHPAGLDSSLDY